MGKTTWTFEMESQLALFYEKHTPMKEMCEWFHKNLVPSVQKLCPWD